MTGSRNVTGGIEVASVHTPRRERVVLLPVFIFLTAALPAMVVLPPVAFAAALTSVRPLMTEEYFELRLALSSSASYRVWRTRTPPKIVVDMDAAPDDRLSSVLSVGEPPVRGVRVGRGPLGARVVVDLTYSLPPPVVHREKNILRILLPREFEITDETLVAPGVWFGSIRAGEVYGPVSVKYLKVDLNRPGVRVSPHLAGDAFDLRPLREIVDLEGALGGVNAGYFHWSGRPLGLLILEGRIVSEALYRRAAFGLRRDGTPFIARLDTKLWLEGINNRRIPVDGINRPRRPGEVVVYTAPYGLLPPPGGHRIHVRDGVVTPGSPMWSVVPDGSLVVEHEPEDARFQEVRRGDVLRFSFSTDPPGSSSVVFALGGGPQLLADGRVKITGDAEQFQPDVLHGRAPRTAIGLTGDGRLLLVVVDGRDETRSVGVTLPELAEMMKALGAVSAMNLDGGGSSTLVLRGFLLNRPSDGEERPVASALLVFAASRERDAERSEFFLSR